MAHLKRVEMPASSNEGTNATRLEQLHPSQEKGEEAVPLWSMQSRGDLPACVWEGQGKGPSLASE